ncbi:lytic transglycosylase domain-containing protein [Vogesella sp. GCM10023246]|uniref:Lytic transglycosylase domain-containing protein n=1 Tax=Vogesella oryzagri TaxID=3160864 RepID=A0ABV1M804_9NEIS
MDTLPPPRHSFRLAKPAVLALLSLVCSGMALGAGGDIYSFTDSEGVVHLSNVPQDWRYRLLQRGPREPAQASTRSRRQADSQQLRLRWGELVDRTAQALSMDAALLHAVVATESGYNPQAVSPKGAMGLMQLMPATALRYGVADPLDPEQNMRAGALYLRDLMTRFQNNLHLALAAYNAGEQAVMRYNNTVPPYQETRNYIPRVLGHYSRNQQQP